MIDFSSLIERMARDTFPGLCPSLWLEYPSGRCIALLQNPVTGAVLALGVGPDQPAACVMVLQQLTTGNYTLTTAEVAAVLGVIQQRVSAMILQGQIRPVTPASKKAHRYAVADVGALYRRRAHGAAPAKGE